MFDEGDDEIIILRAFLNGIIGLVVLFAGTMVADNVLCWFDAIDAISHAISLGLGSVAAATALILMSRLQRQARNLSIGNLIVQNILSAIFIGFFLWPIRS